MKPTKYWTRKIAVYKGHEKPASRFKRFSINGFFGRNFAALKEIIGNSFPKLSRKLFFKLKHQLCPSY